MYACDMAVHALLILMILSPTNRPRWCGCPGVHAYEDDGDNQFAPNPMSGEERKEHITQRIVVRVS